MPTTPKPPRTLLDLLQSQDPAHTAVIVPDLRLRVTYAALVEQVADVAAGLASAGITRQDRVALVLSNGLAAVVSLLAAATAGTAAPLNPAYQEEEFKFYLEDTSARLLVVPPEGADAAKRAARDRVPIVAIETDQDGVVRLTRAAGSRPLRPAASDDPALVLHTTGTTGRPKRVPLSHANLVVSAENVARSYALQGDDVALCVMPLFHVHGLVASTLATFASGGTVVLPARFNPLAFWRIARAYEVTWYSAVPSLHQVLLARAEGSMVKPGPSSRFRFIRSCSAPLAPATMAKLEARFGVPVLEAYGMTEASHQMASNPLPPAARKPGSVGSGTGVRIAIVGPEFQPLPPGEEGEVVIQGPSVTRGYENNPEANAEAFIDGWFRTGDVGALDRHGYLTLIGRMKELINRGGEKISPREIDEVLLTHPSVAEAVSFGVPHPTWGEEVVAAVVLRQTLSEKELLAYCRDRLADFKCPKQIHITASIPRSATGKLQRRLVKETYLETRS